MREGAGRGAHCPPAAGWPPLGTLRPPAGGARRAAPAGWGAQAQSGAAGADGKRRPRAARCGPAAGRRAPIRTPSQPATLRTPGTPTRASRGRTSIPAARAEPAAGTARARSTHAQRCGPEGCLSPTERGSPAAAAGPRPALTFSFATAPGDAEPRPTQTPRSRRRCRPKPAPLGPPRLAPVLSARPRPSPRCPSRRVGFKARELKAVQFNCRIR